MRGSLLIRLAKAGDPQAAGTQNCVGPDSKLGFAVTTGFIWNLPWIAPGDRLSAGIVYSEGAIGYAAVTPSGGRLAGKYDLGMLCVAAGESEGFSALDTNWPAKALELVLSRSAKRCSSPRR